MDPWWVVGGSVGGAGTGIISQFPPWVAKGQGGGEFILSSGESVSTTY